MTLFIVEVCTTPLGDDDTAVAGEEEEEEEGITALYAGTTILTLFTIIMFFTIIFEKWKESLLENTSENMQLVYTSLFGELTVLGFISLLLFLLSQTELTSISSYIYGDGEEDYLKEMFEMVHMALFFVMVLFLACVVGLVKLCQRLANEWRMAEKAIHEKGHGTANAAREWVAQQQAEGRGRADWHTEEPSQLRLQVKRRRSESDAPADLGVSLNVALAAQHWRRKSSKAVQRRKKAGMKKTKSIDSAGKATTAARRATEKVKAKEHGWFGHWVVHPYHELTNRVGTRKTIYDAGCYAIRRAEFIHAPPKDDVRCENSFDFAEYLSVVMGKALSEMVEVPVHTWLVLWIPVCFFCLVLAAGGKGNNNEGHEMHVLDLEFVILAASYLLLALAFYLNAKLDWINEQLVCDVKAPVPGVRSAVFAQVHFGNGTQSLDPEEDELVSSSSFDGRSEEKDILSPLLAPSQRYGSLDKVEAGHGGGAANIGINTAVAASAMGGGRTRASHPHISLASPSLTRDVSQHFESDTEAFWVVETMVGNLLPEDVKWQLLPPKYRELDALRMLTGHHQLLWHHQHGNHLLLSGLRLLLLLAAIQIAVFVVAVAQPLREETTALEFAIFALAAAVPPLSLLVLFPPLIMKYAVACGTGYLRDPQAIRKVIRLQKTRKMIRALHLVKSIHTNAHRLKVMLESSGKLDDVDLDAIEDPELLETIEDARNAFRMFDLDHSGKMGKEELGGLLASVGLRVTSDKEMNLILNKLDGDGSGEIEEDEFVQWMVLMHTPEDAFDVEKLAEDIMFVLAHQDDTSAAGTCEEGGEESSDRSSLLHKDVEEDEVKSMTVDEFTRAIQRIDPSATFTEINEIVSEVDENGDGLIEVEELAEMLKKYTD